MSRILTIVVLALTGLLLAGCSSDEIKKPVVLDCPVEENPSFQSNTKSIAYRKILDDYVRRGLPGISLLVKDSTGFFIGSAGMADISENIPMQPCHAAKIACVTKMMIGVTVMRLQEKGILSLNDPVSKYIPENQLRKIANGNEPVTIRNLMNHTTGFYDIIDDEGFYLQILNDPARKWTAGELLEYVYNKDAMFSFRPADTVGYSNTNYLLLSMVIESATGVPHAVVLRDEVISRLSMNDTRYYWHDPLPETGIAQGYYDLYNSGRIENLSHWNTGSGNGFTGVYSTVWDMYLFADALFESKTLISQPALDEMMTFHPDSEARKQSGGA
ncbi:Beta-lactamase [anaerobic digester metagenome]